MVAFSCSIDALRATNDIAGKQNYSWQTLSPDGSGVFSSTQIQLATIPLHDANDLDMIVICGGDRSHSYSNAVLTNWLHAMAKNGKRIGSISDGAFVVADTGLFDKVASTIHWKCYDAYRERFPELNIRPSILEISEKRFSCAGGTSSLDLMLHFISENHGPEIAGQVADNYFHDFIRDSSREQHMTNAFRLANKNPKLAEALLLMEENLETPLSIFQLAEKLQLSRRQLDRIFARYLQNTPQKLYRDLRLTRASGLLLQTGMSVSEVAVGCGFQSASHMGKYFFERFGQTPGEYRRQKNLA